jgi:hypothetical protein
MFDLGDGIAEVAYLDDFWLFTMMWARDDAIPGHLRKLRFCDDARCGIPEK